MGENSVKHPKESTNGASLQLLVIRRFHHVGLFVCVMMMMMIAVTNHDHHRHVIAVMADALAEGGRWPGISRPRRRVGIVGYGHLGQHLARAVLLDAAFAVGDGHELAFVWNRSRAAVDADIAAGVLPAGAA